MAHDGEERAALRTETLEKARRQEADFPVLVERMQALFRSVYPPHVIAVVAGWGLRTAVSETRMSTRTMIPGIDQHHVEMLQAIALTLSWDDWGDAPADPADIQAAVDTIRELTEAFHGRRYLAFAALTDSAETAVAALQDRLRTNTQMVRNWGYYREVLRISRDLYGALDEQIFKHHGFTATQAIGVVEAVVDVVERQIDDRFRLLKTIFRARSIRQLVRLFFERYPGVAGDPQAFLDSLVPNEPIESVRFRLLSHADRWLLVCSIAPVAKVAERAGVEADIAERLLDRLCLAPGALVGRDVEQLFMSNPMWTRPGLKTGSDHFFATPQTAASFIHEVVGAIIEEAGLGEALSRRRAAFLEAEAARLIAKALPGATVSTGVSWRWEEKPFETDVLAILDRTVLIVEAKSARLTQEGLRGAPRRAARHIRELVVEPSIQSERLEGVIHRAGAGDVEAAAVIRRLGLMPGLVDTVVRLTVTLDDFSVLSSSDGLLRKAGFVPDTVTLAPTLNVADLGCVADLLTPMQFIHYFVERGRLQKRVNLVGDELDLLGLYLQTGFSLNGRPEVQTLAMPGMSIEVDRYYTGLDAGLRVRKPVARQGDLVQALLGPLEQRRPEGWTTAALDLIRSASHEEQRRLMRTLDDLRTRLAKTFRDPNPQNALVWTPPDPDDAVLLFYLFPRALEDDRRNALMNLAAEALERSGRSRCTFVGRMIEEWNEPWHVIGVAYADTAASGQRESGEQP